ncbi:b3 domain-containing protein rem19 [Quercus suber]|uniref:B3 domain-containing protein rem19 n=1 Tax=Quercus suber TaxID=58331 RepID=A0AAW0L6T9_QUESU
MKQLNGKDKAEALKKASGFKLKIPYFMVVMQPSFVKACEPVSFAKKMYIQNGQDVMLKVGDQSWEVRFLIPRNGRGDSFSNSWSTFANENNLRVGDVCVFKLIKSDDVVLKVSIFRV